MKTKWSLLLLLLCWQNSFSPCAAFSKAIYIQSDGATKWKGMKLSGYRRTVSRVMVHLPGVITPSSSQEVQIWSNGMILFHIFLTQRLIPVTSWLYFRCIGWLINVSLSLDWYACRTFSFQKELSKSSSWELFGRFKQIYLCFNKTCFDFLL